MSYKNGLDMYIFFMYVFYFLIVEGKSLQIQYKYFNINIVYPTPRGLSTTFNTKQNMKLSSMISAIQKQTRYISYHNKPDIWT